MATQYRSASPLYTNDDIAEIALFLEDRSPDKQINPEAVVDAATSRSSPLHRYFNWDDKTAAHKYRIIQARKMIQAICIISEEGTQIRSWHSVVLEDGGQQYVEQEKINRSQDLVTQVIESAHLQLVAWRKRYGTYRHFFQVVEAIDTLDQTIRRKKHGEEKTGRGRNATSKAVHSTT